MGLDDLEALQGFLEAMPESLLVFFHPHRFGRAEFTVIAELPNDYLLIEFPRVGRERQELGV